MGGVPFNDEEGEEENYSNVNNGRVSYTFYLWLVLSDYSEMMLTPAGSVVDEL